MDVVRKSIMYLFLLVLWICAAAPGHAGEVLLLREVISREMTVQNGDVGEDPTRNVVSREMTLFTGQNTEPEYARSISREISLLVSNEAPPKQIEGLVVTPNVTGESVTLDWSAYDEVGQHDIAYYLVYQSDTPFTVITNDMKPVMMVPAGTKMAVIEGLEPGEEVYFAVVPVDVGGSFVVMIYYAGSYPLYPQVISREVVIHTGSSSEPDFPQAISREISLAVTDDTPPDAIDNVQVRIDDNGVITLNWSSYDENAQGDISHYRILVYKHPVDGELDEDSAIREVTVLAGTMSFVFDDLPPGETYYFVVLPVDLSGNFSFFFTYSGAYQHMGEIVSREISVSHGVVDHSDQPETLGRELTVVVYDNVPPDPVTGSGSGFAAATSDDEYGAVHLAWRSYDEVAQHDVVRYAVYANKVFYVDVSNIDPVDTVPAENFEFTLKGLEGGEIYYVAVVAVDAAGNYNPVVRSLSVQSSQSALGEVQNLTVTSYRESLLFQWQAPEDARVFLDRYRIYLGEDAKPITLDANQLSYEATGLKAAHGYPFRITTVDTFDKESEGITLIAATLLDNPSGVKAIPFDRTVRLEWTPVQPESLVKHYAVYMNQSPFTSVGEMKPVMTTSGSPADVTGLTNGVQYYFAVTTVNISDGEQKEVVNITGMPVEITIPDLAVESLAIGVLPEYFGDEVEVSFTILNRGNASANITWKDELILSPVNSSNVSVAVFSATSADVIPLSSGSGYSRTFKGVIPYRSDLPAGEYVFRVTADRDHQLTESDESNNMKESQPFTLNLLPRPDLVVSDISLPSTALPGQSIGVSWRIKNAGFTSLSGTWRETVSLIPKSGNEKTLQLGSFQFNDPLEHDKSLVRNQQVTIPIDRMAGESYVMVTADAEDSIKEVDETNNSVTSTNTLSIPALLTLKVSPSSLTEDGQPASALITRNGDRKNPLVVTITMDDSSELSAPASVVILTGQSTASFEVKPVSDNVVDGTQQVTLTATAEGYQGETVTLTVHDANLPALSLQFDQDVIEEGGAITATVSRDHVTEEPLTVIFASSDHNQLSVPEKVEIPANAANSPPVSLVAVNDTLPELERNYTVTVSAFRMSPVSKMVTVIDDDIPIINVTIDASSVSEGAGSQAAMGTVSRNSASEQPLALVLESSNTGAAIVPSSVTIPAYASSIKFYLSAVDDDAIDGDQEVKISATAIDKKSGQVLVIGTSGPLLVRDDDGPSLKLTVDRDVIAEGVTDAAILTVTRNTDSSTGLTCRLHSDNTKELIVPDSVSIPSGARSVSLKISSVDDGVTDGNAQVVISATAEGFTGGSVMMVVSDIHLPDLVVADTEHPASGITNELIDFRYTIKNQGMQPSSGMLLQRIFLSDDPVLGGDTLLEQYTFTGDIPPEMYFTRTIPVRLPDKPGKYWFVVSTDAAEVVDEVLEENNSSISKTPIQVTKAYAATVQADIETAVADTPVKFKGKAFVPETNTPVPYVLVGLYHNIVNLKNIITS